MEPVATIAAEPPPRAPLPLHFYAHFHPIPVAREMGVNRRIIGSCSEPTPSRSRRRSWA